MGTSLKRKQELPQSLVRRLQEREGLSKELKSLGIPILEDDDKERLGAQMKKLHQSVKKLKK